MDSKERFTERVASYVRYRPTYPPEALALLESECGLRQGAVVADLGAGTGIFSRQLLDFGATVVAVEPNAAMRSEAETALGGYPGYKSVAASAESTGLEARSIDLVTAAQAFHWFDPVSAFVEFRRILRPEGWIALIWNTRRAEGSRFLVGYEQLNRRFAISPNAMKHRNLAEAEMSECFHPSPMQVRRFPHSQSLDEAGLIGLSLSASYSPRPGSPEAAEFEGSLRDLFAECQMDGRVTMRYETEVFYGPAQLLG